jgi:ParB/RepB/Spo0J family partition protein
MSGQVTRYGLVQQLPIDLIDESRFQIRIDYGDIDGLAADVKRRGLLQPILVRPVGERYEVVHGHRRLRASRSLGLKHVLGVVRELDDESSLLVMGSENIQRKQLTPIEEAKLYKKYVETFSKTVEEAARNFETSKDDIRVKLYLLDLPPDIQDKVHSGKIPFYKARQLTILTREPSMTTVIHGEDRGADGKFIGGSPQPAPRTDRHFEAIRILAKDERLPSEKAVAEAAKRTRDGMSVEEAIKEAAKAYGAEKSKERAKSKARPPEEMAKLLLEKLPDPGKLEEKILRQYPLLVRTLLERGLLTCPDCGGSHLVWKCSGREVGK